MQELEEAKADDENKGGAARVGAGLSHPLITAPSNNRNTDKHKRPQ